VKNAQGDRRGSDIAARLAYFLYDYRAPEGGTEEERSAALNAAILHRFPDITDEERIRGYQIATELMKADTAEMKADTAKLKAELRRRKKAEFRRRNI
jgi:hypothetical protein